MTQQPNNMAAVVLVPWMPLWEHISHTINIHAHHVKHKISLPHSEISTGDNLPDSVKTEHAYMLCNSPSSMFYTTWHIASCCLHNVKQTHDTNQTETIRDCYRDTTWEHRCTTNMNQLIDDPCNLSPVHQHQQMMIIVNSTIMPWGELTAELSLHEC